MKKVLISIGILSTLVGCQEGTSNNEEIENLKQQVEELQSQLNQVSSEENNEEKSNSEVQNVVTNSSQDDENDKSICESHLNTEQQYVVNKCTDFTLEDSNLISGISVNRDAFMLEIDNLQDHYILAEDEYSFNSIGSDYLAFNSYWIEYLRVIYNEAGEYYEVYQVFNNGTNDIYLGKLIEKSVFENEEVLTEFGGEM
ncbi:hypothetical protein [Turicibacter sanguinis]|uniref:hypothetical protein n=1 Tax=Turicibacter sanguinis TaxID=154288 RepID=UPI0021D5096D|nr:hypothetical protein [Turicibacter sanguinis]MCU7202468.1 hypothetical protein [Turicibacter sanguinis]